MRHPDTTVIAGARIVSTSGLLETGWLEIEGHLIVAVDIGLCPRPVDMDLGGYTIVPGFVDQHCHGGGGNSFVTTDGAEAYRAAHTHLRHGTTTIVASLVSATLEDLAAQIRTLSPLVDQGVIAGIHLEGPWLSKLYCGAHDKALLRTPDRAEIGELLALGGGRIVMVTIAPELPGGLEAIEQIVRAGAIAAVGHTDAGYDMTCAAVAAGARVATHLTNTMRPLHHRDPGAIDALMEDPRVTVELIADGTHVHPAVLRLVFAGASPSRISLITDAMSAAAGADGHYLLGKLGVDVVDGVARLTDGGSLAGSTLTLDKAMRYMVYQGRIPLPDVITTVSTTPAHALGLDDRGCLEVGKRADLVVLDAHLQVDHVMRRGVWIDIS